MNNEEAFEKWYRDNFGEEGLKRARNHPYLADGEFVYEATKDRLFIWKAAIAYMQEVEASSTSEPVGWITIDKNDNCFLWVEQKPEKVGYFWSACYTEYDLVEPQKLNTRAIKQFLKTQGIDLHWHFGKQIVELYTTPQRQQPLKRLSDEQLDECWEKGNGKFSDIANAIMNEMQELNK